MTLLHFRYASLAIRLQALVLIVLVFGACEKKKDSPVVCETPASYSFFVAGHTYGSPVNFQQGLHPPFKAQIPAINSHPGLVLGVLTGDVVPKPEPEYWDAVEEDLDLFSVPVRIAPGNHDRSLEFNTRFGSPFSTHRVGNDLFLILNAYEWSIEGEQLELAKQLIDSLGPQSDHIFVFTHELLWWAPDNHFRTIRLNDDRNYRATSNYWDVVEPIFQHAGAPVYLFAGDIGATFEASTALYHEEGNITYIANGMGNGTSDSFIYVHVLIDGTLSFTLEALGTDDPKRLGELQDYPIP